MEGNLQRIGAREVFTAGAEGDPLARDIIHRAGRALGAGMVNLIHLFDPDMIAVGGAVSQQWDVLWPIVEQHIEGHAMEPYRQNPKVYRSALGDEIGLLGAAALVWRSAILRSARP